VEDCAGYPSRRIAASGKPRAFLIGMLLLVVLLIVLWALGLMTSYTLGGLLHILLVVAIILFLVHVIQGRSIAD
jgi:low affinity Fe/Cu permease